MLPSSLDQAEDQVILLHRRAGCVCGVPTISGATKRMSEKIPISSIAVLVRGQISRPTKTLCIATINNPLQSMTLLSHIRYASYLPNPQPPHPLFQALNPPSQPLFLLFPPPNLSFRTPFPRLPSFTTVHI